MVINRFDKDSPVRFVVLFLVLFGIFYYFNIFFFGITSPGNHYSAFLDHSFNYIRLLRSILLHSSAQIINWLGFTTKINDYELLVVGKGTIRLVYSCLGLGIMSFFSAFVIAYPHAWKSKLVFLITGNICIELLNIARFVLLTFFWDKRKGAKLDHHTVFNIIIYLIIATSLYFWVRHDENKIRKNAKN